MLNPAYISLVHQTITHSWQSIDSPPALPRGDLNSAIEFLTQIAIETIHKRDAQEELKEGELEANGYELKREELPIADKIKIFVEKKAPFFTRICKSAIPFSLLEKKSAMRALEYSLRVEDESYLFPLLKFEVEGGLKINEKELDARFGKVISSLKIKEIAAACAGLFSEISLREKRFGYIFLWLIQKVGQMSYEIPPIEFFHSSTVKDVLSNYFLNPGNACHRNLIEIFLHKCQYGKLFI